MRSGKEHFSGRLLMADSVEKVSAALIHLHETAKATDSGVATRNL